MKLLKKLLKGFRAHENGPKTTVCAQAPNGTLREITEVKRNPNAANGGYIIVLSGDGEYEEPAEEEPVEEPEENEGGGEDNSDESEGDE